MVGCNCNTPTVDPACCVGALNTGEDCEVSYPKDFYCGFCDGAASVVACQFWLDCCAANKIASNLSTIRFKTQSGRDSVFNIFKFTGAIQFSKYSRFPLGSAVSLNNPAIFDTLCSISAAAAFRDRLNEKTHGQKNDKKKDKVTNDFTFANWSYNDASTAFHKNVVLLKGLFRQKCTSRSSFENSFGLKWVKAGTPILTVGDTPYLGTLNSALVSSCFGLWMDGAFAVVEKKPDDVVKYSDDMIMYPVNPWESPLPCVGYILLPRRNGSFDVISYTYHCRQFVFGEIESTIRGDKNGLIDFIDSAFQFYKSKTGEDLKCSGWLDIAKKLIDPSLEEKDSSKKNTEGVDPKTDPKTEKKDEGSSNDKLNPDFDTNGSSSSDRIPKNNDAEDDQLLDLIAE